jgi:geranylgeranyl pyrophosphate synthase
MELAKGELAERFSTHDWNQSIDDYNKRIYDKTASLICTAAEAGGVLSDAPEEQTRALRTFGYNIGMAFQIVDDVLDFTSNEEALGKPAGNDLLQGTLTLPALLFAHRYKDSPIVQRLRNGSRDEADLMEMVENIRNSTAINEAVSAIDGYRQAAWSVLSTLPDTRPRQSLEALIEYVAQRKS